MIIWLQKDGWQLASGKFLGLFVDGSPKNWGLQFFKWANSGYTWSVLWWYLGWGWWATTGWSIMSCHGIEIPSIPEVMVLMDRQVVDLPTGRENFGDVSCWRRVARFWEDLSMHLPRCCWATTSCEASVLCTRRFHRENSLKITVICEHLIILWMSKHATYAILRPYLKNMDPAFPCEGVVNLDVWKLLGPQLSVTIFVPCRLEDMWMFMGFGIA